MPLWIKGNNAIGTRAMMPSQQWQGRLCIDTSDNAIVIRGIIAIATMEKPWALMATNHHNVGDNNKRQGQQR
jgi:hypothetical protein